LNLHTFVFLLIFTLSNCSNFQTFNLSNFQTFKKTPCFQTSNFQTFKLWTFQTFKPSNFKKSWFLLQTGTPRGTSYRSRGSPGIPGWAFEID